MDLIGGLWGNNKKEEELRKKEEELKKREEQIERKRKEFILLQRAAEEQVHQTTREELKRTKQELATLSKEKELKEKKEKEELERQLRKAKAKTEKILVADNNFYKEQAFKEKQPKNEKKQKKEPVKELKRKVEDEPTTRTKKTKKEKSDEKPSITVVHQVIVQAKEVPKQVESKPSTSPGKIVEGPKYKGVYKQFIYLYCDMTGQKRQEFMNSDERVNEFISFFQLNLKCTTLKKNFKPGKKDDDYQSLFFYLLEKSAEKQDDIISSILLEKLKGKFNQGLIPFLCFYACQVVDNKKQLAKKVTEMMKTKSNIENFTKKYNLEGGIKSETILNETNSMKIHDALEKVNESKLKPLFKDACLAIVKIMFGDVKSVKEDKK